MANNYADDQMRYKKKKPSSKSKSKQRSDHKHKYEKVICLYTFGPSWNNRCQICGRMTGGERLSAAGDPDNALYEKVAEKWYNRRPLTIEELRQKFPGVDIYQADWKKDETGRTLYEFEYTLLEE